MTDERPLFGGIDEMEQELAGEAPRAEVEPGLPSLGLRVPADVVDGTTRPFDAAEGPEARDPDPMNVAER